jgi:hypothetical protein
MYQQIIAKNFKEQFCYNSNINDDIFHTVFEFLHNSKDEILIDIVLENKKLTYLKEIKKTWPLINNIITYDYMFFKLIIHTFITLFKKDILNALLHNTHINNRIITKNIIIDIKFTTHNNKYFITLNIHWKTAKLIYKILYLNNKYTNTNTNISINHIYLYNNLNELIKIEYYTKKKNNNSSKKNIILNILLLFINNYYSKLKNKYTPFDNNENFYEINNINLILNFKIFSSKNIFNNKIIYDIIKHINFIL